MKFQRKSTILLFGIAILMFTACQSNTTHKKLMNNFFVIPVHEKFLPLTYVDTGYEYNGYYVLKTNDTIFYNVFYFVSPLLEECPEWPKPSISYDTLIDNLDTVIVSKRVGSYDSDDRDVNRRQNVFYRFSDELKVDYKITVPVDSNKGGLFGIFVDSFYVSDNRVLQMNIYIENPKSGTYKELYTSFFNILFVPFDEKKFILPEPRIY